jgi:hypothetical protein
LSAGFLKDLFLDLHDLVAETRTPRRLAMPTQRIGAACFYTAVAVSQSFIAVVAGSGPGFRSLVLSAAGKSVQAVRSYNPE